MAEMRDVRDVSFHVADDEKDDEKGLDKAYSKKPTKLLYLTEYCEHQGIESRIPESVYGAVAIMPIMSEMKSCRHWLRDCMTNELGLFLNNVLQLVFVYGIREITNVQHIYIETGECDKLTMAPGFVCLCVGIYLMYISNDIEDTVLLAELYFDLVPTTEGHSKPLVFEIEDDVPVLVSGGLSRRRKATLGIVVLGVKFLIACLLAVYGSMYLAASASDGDLILNTLALVFVLDLDELIYSVMAPMTSRRVMAAVPAFSRVSRRPLFKLLESIGPLLKMLMCFSLMMCSVTIFPICGYPAGIWGVHEEPSGRPPIER